MPPSPGRIYILRNRAFGTAVVKIGKTARTSEERASELSSATGVPAPFEVLYEEDIDDIDLAERLIHARLGPHRISERREFFDVPLKTAVRAVFEVCMQVEKLAHGKAVPRIVLFMDGARSRSRGGSARRVCRVLAPFRGGNAAVFVEYRTGNVGAMLVLPDEWRVTFSPALVAALQKLGPGIGWNWFTSPDDSDLQFEEVPF